MISEGIELSIVLPTYNECENLKLFIPQIEEAFKQHPFEIIIVDDNSKDGTGELIQDFNKKFSNITFISRKNISGIGSALRDGYNAARGELILSSDSDLSFSSNDMIRLYEKMLEGHDMVLGYKQNVEDESNQNKSSVSRFKNFLSRAGNWLARHAGSVDVKNFSTNFRILRRSRWLELYTTETAHSFLLETVFKATKKGFQIAEIPVSFYDRKFGISKLQLWKEAPRFLMKVFKYGVLEK